MNNRLALLSIMVGLTLNAASPALAQDVDARKYCPDGQCYEIGKKPKQPVTLYDVVHVMRDEEIPRTASGNRKAGYFPLDKLQDAIDRVGPGGEVLLHKGDYVYDSLILRTRRPFSLRAYADPTFGHIEHVTLRPTGHCLSIAPIFNEALPPPSIILGELRIAPQSLAGKTCIEIENATLTLRNVEMDLSELTNKHGVRVRSGKLVANGSAFKGAVRGALTNEGVLVDPDAEVETINTVFVFLKTGAHILRSSGMGSPEPRTTSRFSKTGFASNITGLLVDGAAEIVDQSQFDGNDVGVVVSGGAVIRQASFERNGVGVRAADRLVGLLSIDATSFDGDNRPSVGVEISPPQNVDEYRGVTSISNSTFIGLERAVAASASAEIGPNNIFGPGSSTGMAGAAFFRQRNEIAIALSGADIFSFYDIKNNAFNDNDVSLSVADNFSGALIFSGNIGEVRAGSRRKNIPPNNMLQINEPSTIVIDPCEFGTAALDLEIGHKKRGLGRVRTCNARR